MGLPTMLDLPIITASFPERSDLIFSIVCYNPSGVHGTKNLDQTITYPRFLRENRQHLLLV